jgi:hypothetical protein
MKQPFPIGGRSVDLTQGKHLFPTSHFPAQSLPFRKRSTTLQTLDFGFTTAEKMLGVPESLAGALRCKFNGIYSTYADIRIKNFPFYACDISGSDWVKFIFFSVCILSIYFLPTMICAAQRSNLVNLSLRNLPCANSTATAQDAVKDIPVLGLPEYCDCAKFIAFLPNEMEGHANAPDSSTGRPTIDIFDGEKFVATMVEAIRNEFAKIGIRDEGYNPPRLVTFDGMEIALHCTVEAFFLEKHVRHGEK